MNTTEAQNPPAFPRPSFGPNEPANGMSLRDYFAAKAMQGIALQLDDASITELAEGISSASRMAAASYVIADAMLKARGL